MDLERIRKMNDEELENYLKTLTSKRGACIKCGATKPNYSIYIQNDKKSQKKKLCVLCDNCYTKLLDYLGVCDILWD